MTTQSLSKTRINRLRTQGYTNQSEQELSEMAFGIRFAYRVCLTVIIVATLTQSVALFSAMMSIAFLSVLMPNHPFDYVYNYWLSKWMNKPALPPRSAQLKFACTIATVWLGSIVFFLASGFTLTAMILAGLLISVAALLSTTDICIPSIIFNALFRRKTNQIKA